VADYGRCLAPFPDGEPARAGFNALVIPTSPIRRTPGLRERVFGPGLHICAVCGGDFANPAAWEEADYATWVVSLRCGGCGHERDATVGKSAVRRFNRALDRGYKTIERAAERLEHELMTAWVEAFGAALERDLIDATDFGR
jgi:hypothetical protein